MILKTGSYKMSMKKIFNKMWSKMGIKPLFLIISFLMISTNGFTDTKPLRIVSISPSLTEILFAIGAGTQVVAVDSYSTYPKEAPITLLSSLQPSIEAIATFEPDLVLLSYDIGDLVKGLNTVGIETMLMPAPVDFEEILLQIKNIGRRTGNFEESNKLVNKMKIEMKNLIELMKTKSQIKIYHEIDENYYTASSNSFIGSIYELLGIINIADQVDRDGNGYPKLSPEYILLSNPDVIILPGKDANYIDKLKKRPGWLSINAVKKDRLLIIDPDIGSRWGPRIIDFAKVIVRQLVLN